MMKPKKASICILTTGSGVDKRTSKESMFLKQAGFEVILLAIKKNILLVQRKNDDEVVIDVSPINTIRGKMVRSNRIIKRLIYLLDRVTRPIMAFARLLHFAIRIEADAYHAHSSFYTIILTWIIAKIKKSYYFADFNDAIVWLSYTINNTKVKEDTINMRHYYNQENIWGRPLDDRDQERITVLKNMIPNDVKSIIDVGCGDGIVTNTLLRNEWDIFGLDISIVALRYLKGQGIVGTAGSLPFKDNSFDLTLSVENLEHIPLPSYHSALRELCRVSRKYILLEVPYSQQLKIGMEKCIICSTIFHANYHFKSFNEAKMKRLFGGTAYLIDYRICGIQQPYYNSILLWIRHHIGGRWCKSPFAICPRCGSAQNLTGLLEINSIVRKCNNLNKMIVNRKQLKMSQICVLYQLSK